MKSWEDEEEPSKQEAPRLHWSVGLGALSQSGGVT